MEEKPSKKIKLDAESQVVFDGVGSVFGKALPRTKPHAHIVEEVEEDDEEEAPMLLNQELPTFKAVIDKADAIIHLLDARDPLSFRSLELERLCEEGGKKQLFILNKIGQLPTVAKQSNSHQQ